LAVRSLAGAAEKPQTQAASPAL